MNNTYCKFVFQESGLSKWIGNKLSPLGSLPVWLIILISSLLVTSLTEVASNPATITLLLPILSPLVSISLSYLFSSLKEQCPTWRVLILWGRIIWGLNGSLQVTYKVVLICIHTFLGDLNSGELFSSVFKQQDLKRTIYLLSAHSFPLQINGRVNSDPLQLQKILGFSAS